MAKYGKCTQKFLVYYTYRKVNRETRCIYCTDFQKKKDVRIVHRLSIAELDRIGLKGEFLKFLTSYFSK